MNKTQKYIDLEDNYGALNYKPLPVVLNRGKGVFLYDVDGKKYYDFLSSYSAVNQGHCHPVIIKSLNKQSKKLTLTSRAFYNDKLGVYEKYITDVFGYDRLLPMNTGAEAVETAMKIARLWAYKVKKIEPNKANIIVCNNNFHGRTISVISASTDDGASRDGFGPFTPGFIKIRYNHIDSLSFTIKNNPNIAAFLVEPIQGEAGVILPDDNYIQEAMNLCKKNNILFIADEIQTGMGRTGKMLAMDYFDGKPDVLILGKALSGGVLPVSAVMANNDIMEVIKPGSHGSTFGGNPLACAVAMDAVKVIIDEKLIDNSYNLGKLFRQKMLDYSKGSKYIKDVRGKGLLNAIVMNKFEGVNAYNICLDLMKNGLLAKYAREDVIRLAPPLVMNKKQMLECIDIIKSVFEKIK